MLSRNKYFIKKETGREIDDAVLTATEKDAAKLEQPLSKLSLKVFWLLSAAVLCILGGRAFTLNVVEGAKYQDAAMRNSLRALVIPAPRGIIYDAYGKPLVYNVPSIDVVLTPADAPQDKETQERVKGELSSMGIDRSLLDQTFDALDFHSTDPILLKEKISPEEALVLLSKNRELQGVALYKTTNREYIDSTIFSHVLGYEGKIKKEELVAHPDYLLTDSIGKLGIEKSYEEYLRGKHGYQRAEVDALGNVKQELGTISPVAGNDLILNIDADLQKKLYDSLSTLLEERGLKQAAAIAMDPRNGAVRALVSLPSFDNNLFARGITTEEYQGLANDPARPMFNRATVGEYPPGSTIKPVLAVAGLSEGTITEHTEIESRGGISVGSFFFGDWKAHGVTDLRRAIAVSSDVYFYSVGGGYGSVQGLGMERMKKYENLFGYGEKTAIDLPAESEGLIPDPAWKRERIGERWYIGDDYNSSIGQGFTTATPLQVLNSITAIANGGTLYEPRVVSQVRSTDGKVTAIPSKVIRDHIANPDYLRIVREGMRETVTEGTAQQLKDLPVEVAGKTGTAQFGGEQKTHGWFVSFAPFQNPELAIIVLVEGQGEEGYNAVPVTHDAYEWYFTRKKEE